MRAIDESSPSKLWLGVLLTLVMGCSSQPKRELAPTPPDENLSLEDVKSAKSLAWVAEQNLKSLGSLQKLPHYKQNEADIKAILLAKDRLPIITEMGAYVYNFWQDDNNPRGLWRRTTLTSYKTKNPKWETVLNLDRVAKKEKENWVYKGAKCLPPRFELCMLRLSRGGGDVAVEREFNTLKKDFVAEGFNLPAAKSSLDWVDENTLVVATDFGPGSLTHSGYPRIAKLWSRGQPLTAAKQIFEGKTTDVNAEVGVIHTPQGHKAFVESRATFFETDTFILNPEKTLVKLEKPRDAEWVAWLNAQDVLQLRSDWNVRGEIFKAGSLVALSIFPNGQPKLIFAPNEKQSIERIEQSKDALVISGLDSVQSMVLRAYPKGDAWVVEKIPFPEGGDIQTTSVQAFSNQVIAVYQNFTLPPAVMLLNVGLDKPAIEARPEILKSLPARFDGSQFKSEQLWATSKDGTQVPYFLISSKKMNLDGSTPTLIYGYGGFEISPGPVYLSVVGKLWLEKGGAYVIANIRGGGEFGPAWHRAALKENRQKAYDDFIAVGEDLVKRKISSQKHMAISGRSNGGLLVGATFVQRPDLYKAVICEVPLLDMLRYNKLLAGASWEGEYGNPDDPVDQEAILKYSPYQNVKAGVSYPEVFFMTSTMDDRVHPGHARKMVARMMAQGHPLLYFENTEGGHSAAANIQQKVKTSALQYTFLQDRLLKK